MDLPRFLFRIAAQIRAAADPDRIVLFGSYAKGRQNARSDADFLVIGNFGARGLRLSQELQDIAGLYPIGLDFHCVSEADLARALARPGSFYHSALTGGIVLFDRNDRRNILAKDPNSDMLSSVGKT